MVIDGCPYKENQKERAWETGLSTTVSQISTLQSTVAGKADAGTEITGGTFSDGILTLDKASGDITIGGFSDSGKQLVTSGTVSNFMSISRDWIRVDTEFEIEYINANIIGNSYTQTSMSKVYMGTYNVESDVDSKIAIVNDSYIKFNNDIPRIQVYSFNDVAEITYLEDLTNLSGSYYRLYA